MKEGEEGRPSSIAMVQSYCTPTVNIPLNRKVAVIDAGGTNLRTCSIYFDEKLEPVFEDFEHTTMPGIKEEVSADTFFAVFADQVERLVDKTDAMGFCFSYAAEILPDHDGVPFLMSKEVKAPQIVGKHLGKELFAKLSQRGHDMSSKKIIVMNDTVTTLLAALPAAKTMGCEACIGFILGTGTNTAFMGKNGIINEESAGLDIRLGDIDRRFTDSTLDPNEHLLEKAVGGAYLGPLALMIIKTAAVEGVFSPSFVNAVESLDKLGTNEMTSFIADTPSVLDSCISTQQDGIKLRAILEAFVGRTAKIAAANIAASVLYTEYGKKKPVLVNADGTTFYNTPGLKEKIESYLADYLAPKGRSVIFTNIRRSPMIGSAIGALSLLSDVAQ
jgi:hexokinase